MNDMQNDEVRTGIDHHESFEAPALVEYGRWDTLTREVERGGCGSGKDIQAEASGDPNY